jgi:hypothetical protein
MFDSSRANLISSSSLCNIRPPKHVTFKSEPARYAGERVY